jgi:SAM-dependent methyltransferase
VAPQARTLLDVACGTGQHLRYLQDDYTVEGLDLSPDMLAVARQCTPGVPYHQGNIVDFDLRRSFDVVTCLFGSIGYTRVRSDLVRAVQNLVRHVSVGGCLVVEPWFAPDLFRERLTADFVDDPDFKVARMYVSRVEDRVSILDISYLVGTPEGIETFSERHELGLFTHAQYAEAFTEAGFDMSYDPQCLFYGAYVGVRSSG